MVGVARFGRDERGGTGAGGADAVRSGGLGDQAGGVCWEPKEGGAAASGRSGTIVGRAVKGRGTLPGAEVAASDGA